MIDEMNHENEEKPCPQQKEQETTAFEPTTAAEEIPAAETAAGEPPAATYAAGPGAEQHTQIPPAATYTAGPGTEQRTQVPPAATYAAGPGAEQHTQIPPAATYAAGPGAEPRTQIPPYSQPYYPPQGYYQAPMYVYPPYVPQSAPEQPKKEKKPTNVSRGALALCLVLCLVLAAGGGFAGAYAALISGGVRLYAAPAERTTVVYRAAEDKEEVPSPVDDFEKAADIAKKTVVEIATEYTKTSSTSGQYIVSGGGSGVIISEDGVILTCAHVVDGAEKITVTTYDGQIFEATVVGADSITDSAVIRIEATGLPYTEIADSDALRVAQSVMVIGNPLGQLGGSVTVGHISALNRRIQIEGQTYELIQTDAAVNPGNSGGGMFDLNGRLIGIANAKSVGEDVDNICFAIPVNTAIHAAEEILEKGYVGGRPALGIRVIDYVDGVNPLLYRDSEFPDIVPYLSEHGVYFVEMDGGNGEGLKLGDRIVAIDGVQVTTLDDMTSLLLEKYHPGDQIKVTVIRQTWTDGKNLVRNMVDVEMTLIERTGQ